MTTSRFHLWMGLAWLACAGCTWAGPKVWIEQTQELNFDTAGLTALEVRTHNGGINFESQPARNDMAAAVVTKKAGGHTQAEAEEAMAAIGVYSTRQTDGTQRLGWNWDGHKHPNWTAAVGFEIHAPGNLRFDGETHNGAIDVDGITGDVKAVTHNGGVEVVSQNGKLHAETHNGSVVVDYAGSNVNLVTHNGKVVADLGRCSSVSGAITTHNGGVQLVVGDRTSTDLNCETHNGSIKCDVPLGAQRKSRRSLAGKLGEGDGRLNVSTHNGSVRIKGTG